jgi:hypothetical protein
MPSPRALALVVLFALSGCTGTGNNPPTQNLSIGAPCGSSAECGDAPPFACDVTRTGGYCTRPCATNFDCPIEAVCAPVPGAGSVCVKKCDTGNDCRFGEGYVCHSATVEGDLGASQSFCGVPPRDGGALDLARNGAMPDGGAPDGA